MKKNLLAGISMLALAIGILTGCSKDDTTAPVITLSGDQSVTIVKGTAYTDAGATASDDEDGTITVTSDASSSNPNINVPGVYTITYTASDKAGNVATATRTVTVTWSGALLAGTYTCTEHDSFAGIAFDSTFASIVDTSSADPLDFKMSPNAFFSAPIYYHVIDGNKVSVDSQYPNGTGSPFEIVGNGEGTITISGTQTIIDAPMKLIDHTSTPSTEYFITIHAAS